MIREYQLRVLPREAAQEDSLKQTLSREAGIDISRITALQIIKQSIDARQRQIYIQLKVRVFIDEQPVTELFENISYASVSSASSAVVVGAGPAGLFAALRLI
ncbi:MAG: FAD-binding protein, partial [Bacteroidales bacterium]|nr:FAD-binding protein [Bacteroidales bacterium]